MYTIKHRYTGEVIFEGVDLREADLRGADLQEADLRGANLQEANLRGANLQGAYLQWAIGDGHVIRTAQLEKYIVVVCDDWIQIGCKGFRYHEWLSFDDCQIGDMNTGALKWWRKYKDTVLSFADVDYKEGLDE